MSENNKPKDFRNIKQTQFDMGQVIKGSYNELNSALRTVTTNSIIKDVYTHMDITRDVSDRITNVVYYQANTPTKDKLTSIGDVAGSLTGKYLVITQPLTKKTIAFYFVVGGMGVAPGVAIEEHPVNINANDSYQVVTMALAQEIETNTDINVIETNITYGYIILEYSQFGENTLINLGTSGFAQTRIQDGESLIVGEISITYDGNDNPIVNGTTLNGLIFNPITGEFVPSISLAVNNLTVAVDLDGFSATPDSVLSVGSEDGTDTGIKHALKVGNDGNLRVKDESVISEISTLNTDLSAKLDTVNTNLTDINTSLQNPLVIEQPILTAGTEDGTITGTTHVVVNNLKQMIMAAHDRQRTITYADAGTKNQRVTQMDYSSATIGSFIARKTINYILVGNVYVMVDDTWTII